VARPDCLIPQPTEGMDETGPKFEFGCVGIVALLCLTLTALLLTIAVIVDKDSKPLFAYVIVLDASVIALWALLLLMGRGKVTQKGIDVLRDVLGFTIDYNTSGTGVALFCRPDSVMAGSPVALLVFAQNYYSRSRIVTIQLPKTGLGKRSVRKICFQLSPGQAAVYRDTFQADSKAGRFVLKVRFKVKMVRAQGKRVIPKSAKETRAVFAKARHVMIPLEIRPADPAVSDFSQLPAAECLSLYYPELPEPRFEILHHLTTALPTEPIAGPALDEV
jgi:hypothetical protein